MDASYISQSNLPNAYHRPYYAQTCKAYSVGHFAIIYQNQACNKEH
ncbi:hypothetical protein RG47T_2811 [Mucilaginibacter polytrichastri]|uniref:Uncharacterized protein n=1 Tax=Mucilaginibacter polytrichastri TaxID=1302689 RepID=A0A1Q6A010_9SPHI|nr:hypothetical protein RG47T_2811 [Mucilaginibacter polytrichastri]